MSVETPKFCSSLQDYNFTTVSEVAKSRKGGVRKKKKKKNKIFSLENIENNKYRKSSLSKLIKSREKEIKHKKRRNRSVLLDMSKYNMNNINIFMIKKKFHLRNDFDKKHVEKFLLSKEQAFENPFLLYN